MAEIIIDHTVPKIDVDDDEIEFKSSITIQAIMVFLLALFFGIVASAYILPRWLPNIANSFLGTSPKAYWFMSRGTGFVSLGLLWASIPAGPVAHAFWVHSISPRLGGAGTTWFLCLVHHCPDFLPS